jgi:hypothetical protein
MKGVGHRGGKQETKGPGWELWGWPLDSSHMVTGGWAVSLLASVSPFVREDGKWSSVPRYPAQKLQALSPDRWPGEYSQSPGQGGFPLRRSPAASSSRQVSPAPLLPSPPLSAWDGVGTLGVRIPVHIRACCAALTSRESGLATPGAGLPSAVTVACRPQR